MTRIKGTSCSFDNCAYGNLAYNNFDLDLGKKSCFNGSASVIFACALLSAAAEDICYCEACNAYLGECVLECIELALTADD